MALLYKDGKTEPKVRDVVLGDGVKGRVESVTKTAVVVSSRGTHDPRRRGPEKKVQRELDPAKLELVHRS